VGLRLRATGDGVGFPSRLGGEQMSRGLASGGLTGSLFGTSHVDCRLGFSVSFFKKKGGAGGAGMGRRGTRDDRET
jgi:hypothetical protein